MNYPFDENLFHSGNPDAVESSAAVNEGDEELPYPQPSTAEELVHPPDFKPLFTLIEDPETSEHHHPTVHYVFSDDDPEIMTNAALDALAAHENDNDDSRSPSEKDEEEGEQEERCVFLDMAADGKTVVSASSLSPGWQALRTSVTQAPSWGEVGNDGDGRLLLKISGQEIGASRRARAKQKQQQQQEEEKSEAGLDELVKMFGYRLEGLEQVMERTKEKDDEDEDHRMI